MTDPTLPAPAWRPLSSDIDAFLTAYAGDGEAADPGAHFAEAFLALDPGHARVLRRDALVAALPARRRMFADAGVAPLRRTTAHQLDLDERHLLVRVGWRGDRDGGAALRLDSTFLLRREPDGPRILVYLNHHDLAALLSTGASRDATPPGSTGR